MSIESVLVVILYKGLNVDDNDVENPKLVELGDRVDSLIMEYTDELEAYEVAGMMLGRVIALMTMEPDVGKHMLKYTWEQLDIIEQARPGDMI
jgi:hypothetical protein